MYQDLPWDDLWPDANLVPVIRYLRGARKTTIPPEWKEVVVQGLAEATSDPAMQGCAFFC